MGVVIGWLMLAVLMGGGMWFAAKLAGWRDAAIAGVAGVVIAGWARIAAKLIAGQW